MAAKASVSLRLGAEGDEKIIAALKQIGATGDASFAGLSKEAKQAASAFDRLERSLDVSARSAAQVAKTYVTAERAVAAGIKTQEDAQRVLDLATRRHLQLTGAVNDNAHAAGLARHEWINLSRQFQDIGVSLAGGQSPLTVMLQQGSQLADIFGTSQAGAAGALRSFGAGAIRALTSPIGVAVELTAAIAGIELAAGKAETALAKIGETAKLSGLSAEQIQGAKIVGAGVGLDEKSAVGAFANASQQFEQFARNQGAVKSALEKIDAGFLNVADRAKTAGEFIDIIERKIQELPRAEGLDLAQALFGEDAGRQLFDAIESGAASMGRLVEATGRAGDSLDQAARAAHETQLQIDKAAAIASDKLLQAFQDLGDPVASVKLGWYEIVGSIAQSVSESKNLQAVMRGFLHPFDTVRELVTGETQFRGRLIPPGEAGIVQPETAGASRARFAQRAEEASAARRAGGSRGASTQNRFADIEADLRNRIALAASEGAEHDKIALKIKIENEQHRLGANATREQKDTVAQLVTQLDEAEQRTKNAAKAAEDWRDKMREVADIARSSFSSLANDLVSGKNAGDAFKNVLDQIQRKVIDIASRSLTDSLFGKAGDKASGGGILGSLFGGGSGGGLGGLLGSIFGGGKSSGGFASGVPLFSGKAFSFGFPDGGVAGMPTRHLFSAPAGAFRNAPHFADGGGIPAFLHAGEIVLNAAQQRNVAGSMAPSIAVHNYAAGVEVTPQMTPQGVALIVKSIVEANNRNLPSFLADAAARSNRR